MTLTESWELPSYLAGDLIDLDKERETRRAPKPAPEVPYPRRPLPSDLWSENELVKPEGQALYPQDALDQLDAADFHPDGEWTHSRPVGEGSSHTITYAPGYTEPARGHVPWIVTSHPAGRSVAAKSVRSAIALADQDREAINGLPERQASVIPDWTKVGERRTPGQMAADDWERQQDEEDRRQQARDWMDAQPNNEDEGYVHWEPNASDYTYHDVADPAGQTFREGEEPESTATGTYFRNLNHPDTDWETGRRRHNPSYVDENFTGSRPPLTHQFPDDEDGDEHLSGEDDEEPEVDPEEEALYSNGFEEESRGRHGTVWAKDQHDLEGNHIATHRLQKDREGRWNVRTELHDNALPVTFPHSIHGSGESGLDWALYKYKQNSAQAMLPKYGYEPVHGNASGPHFWARNDPSPHGENDPQGGYEHEIMFPETGFAGNTVSNHLSNGGLFGRNGASGHNSDDLADVVREHNRLAAGVHPGGRKDYRMTPDELKADPTVATLGHPHVTDTPWGDNKVTRMEWHLPSPESPRGLRVQGNYNWDTGNYDFKYDHNGTPLAHSHNYVPEGAPVTIPGRQTQIPLGG